MSWDLEAAEREVGPLGNPWRLYRHEWAVHRDGWSHGCGKRGARFFDEATGLAALEAAVVEGHHAVMTVTLTLLRPGYNPKRKTSILWTWASKSRPRPS